MLTPDYVSTAISASNGNFIMHPAGYTANDLKVWLGWSYLVVEELKRMPKANEEAHQRAREVVAHLENGEVWTYDISYLQGWAYAQMNWTAADALKAQRKHLLSEKHTGNIFSRCAECGKLLRVPVTFPSWHEPFETTRFTCPHCSTELVIFDEHEFNEDGTIK